MAVRPGAGRHHGPVGQHDLEAQHAFGGGPTDARTMEQAVLRKRATDRGIGTRKRPPIGRAEAERRQRLVEFLPGASGLDQHIHVVGVDLDDCVHAAHVDEDRAIARGDIAPGIGHAAAARDDGASGLGRACYTGRKLFERTGADNAHRRFARSPAEIGREETTIDVADQQVVRAKQLAKRVQQLRVLALFPFRDIVHINTLPR